MKIILPDTTDNLHASVTTVLSLIILCTTQKMLQARKSFSMGCLLMLNVLVSQLLDNKGRSVLSNSLRSTATPVPAAFSHLDVLEKYTKKAFTLRHHSCIMYELGEALHVKKMADLVGVSVYIILSNYYIYSQKFTYVEFRHRLTNI